MSTPGLTGGYAGQWDNEQRNMMSPAEYYYRKNQSENMQRAALAQQQAMLRPNPWGSVESTTTLIGEVISSVKKVTIKPALKKVLLLTRRLK